MMSQYHEIKQKYADCLLFFRMGDFYELFFEDAIKASAALEITLTKRGQHKGEDIPMCGVPAHASESYLARLIRKGYRVAVCEQANGSTPSSKNFVTKGGKGIIQREVVRVVTPGTLTEESLLEAKHNNYLLALVLDKDVEESCETLHGLFEKNSPVSVACLDISTGEFFLLSTTLSHIPALLSCYNPSEILISETLARKPLIRKELLADYHVVAMSEASFCLQTAEERLKQVYKVPTVNAIGSFDALDLQACGVLLDYLFLTQQGKIPRLDIPRKEGYSKYMHIDAASRRNLELMHSLSGDRRASLYHTIDRTLTAAGGRLLAARLANPIMDIEEISHRLDLVSFFKETESTHHFVIRVLKVCPDMERALSRLSVGRGGPRDLAAIKKGLECADLIIRHFANLPKKAVPKALEPYMAHNSDYHGLIEKLSQALKDELPLLAREGGFIRQGYHKEFDELCQWRDKGTSRIVELQNNYIEATRIQNLKIRHNNVLGYFIEITKSHTSKVPPTFIHRQTMVNNMRFTTQELSDLELHINSAAQKALELELTLYDELVQHALQASRVIIHAARSLAVVDVSQGLAQVSQERNYCRPLVTDQLDFEILQGRHPVVEALMPKEKSFVPNDCVLQANNNLWLITGPNMAGKSTFLRQNALIIILAQIGAFVPAAKATIGLVDKLFSRIGASDDLAHGQSTFMVEMVETATILNQAGRRSFVIIDEVGRGTSTFDGMAIAWAVLEYLIENNVCRGFFATHYHELTKLTQQFSSLSCHTMKIKKWQDNIIFLHTIGQGTADRSYGIHVAKLSGLPEKVIRRAQDILTDLEKTKAIKMAAELPLFTQTIPKEEGDHQKPSKWQEVITQLEEIEMDHMTPRQAFDWIYALKEKLKKSC